MPPYATNKYLLLSLFPSRCFAHLALCILSSIRKQEETKARRESAERRGRMKVVRLVRVLKSSFCKKRTTWRMNAVRLSKGAYLHYLLFLPCAFFLYILLVAFSFFFLLLACLDTLVSSLCFPLLSVPFSLSG